MSLDLIKTGSPCEMVNCYKEIKEVMSKHYIKQRHAYNRCIRDNNSLKACLPIKEMMDDLLKEIICFENRMFEEAPKCKLVCKYMIE